MRSLARLRTLEAAQRAARCREVQHGPPVDPGTAWWTEFLGFVVESPYGPDILGNIGVPAADVPALLAEIQRMLAQEPSA